MKRKLDRNEIKYCDIRILSIETSFNKYKNHLILYELNLSPIKLSMVNIFIINFKIISNLYKDEISVFNDILEDLKELKSYYANTFNKYNSITYM